MFSAFRAHQDMRIRWAAAVVMAMALTSWAGSPAPAATVVDQCAVLSSATVTKLLRGHQAVGTPTKRRSDYCGWHSDGSPPIASGSLVYQVFATEAEAKARYQLFANLSNEKKVTGVGDEAVVSDRPTLAAISARKGKLFVHIEADGKGSSSKPLIPMAKSVIATGHA